MNFEPVLFSEYIIITKMYEPFNFKDWITDEIDIIFWKFNSFIICNNLNIFNVENSLSSIQNSRLLSLQYDVNK